MKPMLLGPLVVWICCGMVTARQVASGRGSDPNKVGNGEAQTLNLDEARMADQGSPYSRVPLVYGPRSARLREGATALDMVRSMYDECLSEGSFSCVKPKILAFLSASSDKENIRLTRDLSIVKAPSYVEPAPEYYLQTPDQSPDDAEKKQALRMLMLDKVDDFLSSHELQIRIPKEIISGSIAPFVPSALMKNIPQEMRIPLAEPETGKGRGLAKKVIMPFLLGLKFKATAVIPLALAFIALKTWKALTLGLLSVVLSGAMIIFKFSKPPRLVNYEVVHYQHHPPPPPPPAVVEHPIAYDHHHPYRRSVEPQQLAYSAHRV
ncbi:unnamed protein product [Bemisia tabaci]|uniref:Osiris 18 n=2 Tax=Bemisia tabaci TaxID=7038 RepID=A0A9P0AAS7_BEMTA|nr:unnamed protein product [Bemisia tabaci]